MLGIPRGIYPSINIYFMHKATREHNRCQCKLCLRNQTFYGIGLIGELSDGLSLPVHVSFGDEPQFTCRSDFFFQSSTVISEYDTTNQKGILMNLTVYTVRILTVYIVRTETVQQVREVAVYLDHTLTVYPVHTLWLYPVHTLTVYPFHILTMSVH